MLSFRICKHISQDTSVYEDWAILVPTNNDVDQLYDKIIQHFSGSNIYSRVDILNGYYLYLGD